MIEAPGRGGALANDMHRLIAEAQEVLATFRGGDGYVSPRGQPTLTTAPLTRGGDNPTMRNRPTGPQSVVAG